MSFTLGILFFFFAFIHCKLRYVKFDDEPNLHNDEFQNRTPRMSCKKKKKKFFSPPKEIESVSRFYFKIYSRGFARTVLLRTNFSIINLPLNRPPFPQIINLGFDAIKQHQKKNKKKISFGFYGRHFIHWYMKRKTVLIGSQIFKLIFISIFC